MALRFYAAPPQILEFFGTVLGIFGVAFVRALNTSYNGSAQWLQLLETSLHIFVQLL